MTPSGDMPTARAQQQSFSLANIVPQQGALNRGVWEGIESAVRDLATQEGQLYVVTGAMFAGNQIQSIGDDGVLVPTDTWKAIYDPQAGTAGAYICTNTNQPQCSTGSIARLARQTGIDVFPGLPNAVKEAGMQLPQPEASPYGEKRGLKRRRASHDFEQSDNWEEMTP